MKQHDDIDSIITTGITIIEKQINLLAAKPDLLVDDISNLTEYLKTLVVIRKDWRLAQKEQTLDVKSMTDEEINAAILAEAEKLK